MARDRKGRFTGRGGRSSPRPAREIFDEMYDRDEKKKRAKESDHLREQDTSRKEVTHQVSSRDEAEWLASKIRRKGQHAQEMTDFDGSWHVEVWSDQINDRMFANYVNIYRSENPVNPPGRRVAGRPLQAQGALFEFQKYYERISSELSMAFEYAERGQTSMLIAHLRSVRAETVKAIDAIQRGE